MSRELRSYSVILPLLWAAASFAANRAELDPDKLASAMGTTPTVSPDGVVKFAWARKDVPVTVDGVKLDPFAGLGSWAAFMPLAGGGMMMGDTVVFEDEVMPAMDAAFASGLAVTALHNHFFYDEPKVYFMHIEGDGDPVKTANAVKAVWDAITKVRADHRQPVRQFTGQPLERSNIDPAPIENILSQKPQVQDGIAKITVGRQGRMGETEIGGSMGLTTWAAFAGTNKSAVVDGDFIMAGPEVQPVLRALRGANINIVALHNHMIGEQPTFYFTHFWGRGPVDQLAQGIKSALDAQKAATGGARPRGPADHLSGR